MHESRTIPRQSWDSTDIADPRQLPDDGLGQSPELETIWLEATQRGKEPSQPSAARTAPPLTEVSG